MAVLLIVMGTAFACVTNLMAFAASADNDMLVVSENQRGIRELKTDLYCSSRNQAGQYAPRFMDGELRLMVVTGFDDQVAFSPMWSGYVVCYKHNSSKKMLVRLFRDALGTQIDAPADFPGPREQTVSNYCTSVSYAIEPNAGMVTVTLTNAIGSDPSDKRYATCQTVFTVIPFNTD
jgi:hypothetical protein